MMFLSCSVFSNDLMSLFLFTAGWQWLIDDTIKSLHLIYSGVKDNILVSSSYLKPLLFWYWWLDFIAGLHVFLVPLMQANFASAFSSMLQAAVVSALSALCEEFYGAEPGQADIQMQGEWTFIPSFDEFHFASGMKSVCLYAHTHTHTDVLVSHYINELKSHQMATCCGSALALGCLPRFLISGKMKQVWSKDSFIHNCGFIWTHFVCFNQE